MLKITILGSGTSHGVPMLGCSCPVCTSKDPKDIRTRASILIQSSHQNIVIDTSTEFRLQAIKAGIKHISAVLYTHTHADHIHGLDDIRPLSRENPVPVYASKAAVKDIKKRFDYVFKTQKIGGGVPRIELHTINDLSKLTFEDSINSIQIIPLKVLHGKLPIYGYRIGNLAYITDCSYIPEPTFEALEGIEILIIGALRQRPHPTHFSFEQAVHAVKRINPQKTYLTHISHNHLHTDIFKILLNLSDKKIEPAYDGLSFTLL